MSNRLPKAFTLMEVAIAIAVFIVILLQMTWVVRLHTQLTKVAQERSIAYKLVLQEIEKKFDDAAWPPTNVARARVSSDPNNPFYNYEIAFNISPVLWDTPELFYPNGDGHITFPNNAIGEPGEFHPTFSNMSTTSVYLRATVFWNDFWGKPQKITVGAVKSRY